MTEYQIQKQILDFLRSRNDCWAVKVEVANERGVPDVICCCRGRFYAFEVKAVKGKATPIQLAQIKRIRLTGGTAAVVHTVEEVRELVKWPFGTTEDT